MYAVFSTGGRQYRAVPGEVIRVDHDWGTPVDPNKVEDALKAAGKVKAHFMSDGTRDQLFLALRLSALGLHLEAGHALPFIADDLFVNFHDQRSRAGLTVLGELARKTQVIFLTHHEHLVEVARECIGPTINVLTLEPR